MPRKPITFMDTTYPTQGAFEKYVKNLIYNEIGICYDIKNKSHSQYKILIELLERHPDYDEKSKNMCNLKIVRDTLNKSAYKILIVKKEGEIDISWHCAITSKHKPFKHELMSAMRSSIDYQICAFKKKTLQRCALCGDDNVMHVHHNDEVNSAFDELAGNFINIMKNENIEIPNEFGDTNDNTHRRCFLQLDNYFETRWIEYHKQCASLRMLCKKCNISRPKTKNKCKLTL